ncbi:MAG: carbamoyltransferase N-terminal domain-containing protein [Ardenticatenales bacterium]
MNVLGLSCHYHDAAAALLVDGQLVAAAEEERFSRRKHDHDFPERAIAFVLRQAGLTPADIDRVVFYEKPLRKFDRILQTSLTSWPSTWGVFRESMVAWFDEKLWVKSLILDKLGVSADNVLFADHHMSHAASAFFCTPWEEAAILTCDGVGEWQTTTIGHGVADWHGGASRISLLDELRFPHSLGLLYSAFTAWLGFRVNSGEYKVMGMAPYGEPKHVDRVWQLVELADDGAFRLNMDYFSFHRSTQRTYNDRFVALFGPARRGESEFYTPRTDPGRDDDGARRNQFYADMAASIQRVTEDIMLALVRRAHARTGAKRLCLAGGVALNSVANARIVAEGPFDEVWIQPAAGDAGGALGAALWAEHCVLGRPRSFVMTHAYWGAGYDEADARRTLDDLGLRYHAFDDLEALYDRVVDVLVDGGVVGWFQGRFEWGPRALGNRSILADPRREAMKEVVNVKIKFREPFRPFAPVVLEERAREYFALPEGKAIGPAEYMLMVADIPPAKRAQIPAVTHVNGTGRLQVVRRDANPAYYRIIEKFGLRTGVPVLLNTSFNLRGEPMVDTPANALATFAHSDIDILVLGNILVDKADAAPDGRPLADHVPPPATSPD